MNCIAQQYATRISNRRARPGGVPALSVAVATLLLLAISGCAVAATDPLPEKIYDVMYTVTPQPRTGTVKVEMRVDQARRLLRAVSMTMPEPRFSNISGDGELTRNGDDLRWAPSAAGGTLRWTVRVENRRYGDTFDARLVENWGLFRASDIIPPASTRTVVDASGRTKMQFDLPDKWSAVTQYPDRRGVYSVINSGRRFDRPTGWILLGKLGVRIETIAGVRVVIGAPVGQNVRRLDMLALLNWTMPQIVDVIPDFPTRIAIVSARDKMWRGGLSGPNSLYIHASLPLISENATSTILHEVMHIGMGLRAAEGADWIVEGLAEYYSLELLRRGRTISNKRFAEAIDDLTRWGAQADMLCTPASTAATTARAVGVFAALDRELQKLTMNKRAMDELTRALIANGDVVSVPDLQRIAKSLAGRRPDVLSNSRLPGCS